MIVSKVLTDSLLKHGKQQLFDGFSIVPNKLEFTGERFTPDCTREIRYEHYHRYALAAEWTGGLKVLDAACGEGYGSHLLAARAGEVTGVDISAAAVTHARNAYNAANLSFLQADCTDLPFENQSFDCIISFETLEHLHDHEALLEEFSRVLKPKGFLVISSPDKAIYTDRLGNENPFHTKELYKAEFEQLLAGHFAAVRWLGQKLGFHSMIWPFQPGNRSEFWLQQESGQSVARLQQPAGDPVYLLALCAASAGDLPRTDQALYLFDDEKESVYRHYNHEIRHNLAAGEVLRDLEQRLASLQAELERLKSGGQAGMVGASGVSEYIPGPAAQSASQAPARASSPPKSWLSRLLRK